MLKPEDFHKGEQVVYVPSHVVEEHADFDPPIEHHPACEKGFVTSHNDEFVFCRFFFQERDKARTLRTTANSEACYPEDLRKFKHCPQRWIGRLLEWIDEDDVDKLMGGIHD